MLQDNTVFQCVIKNLNSVSNMLKMKHFTAYKAAHKTLKNQMESVLKNPVD